MRYGVYEGRGPSAFARAAWRFDLRLPAGAVRPWRHVSEPLAFDDLVVIGAYDFVYHCLDARKAKPRWSFVAHASPPTRGGLASPMLFDDATLLLSCDRAVVGVDRETGVERFRVPHEATLAPPARIGPLIVVSTETHLVGVEIASGREAWRLEAPSESVAPIGWEGDVAVAKLRGGTVLAFDPARGVLRWRHDGPQTGRAPALVHAGVVYAPMGDAGCLRALSADTGELLWEHRVPARVYGAPVLANGVVLFSGVLGTGPAALHAVDARTGEGRWKADVASYAAVVGACVALGDGGGGAVYATASQRLVGLSLATGESLMETETSQTFQTAPVVSGDGLFAATTHHLLAYRG